MRSDQEAEVALTSHRLVLTQSVSIEFVWFTLGIVGYFGDE